MAVLITLPNSVQRSLLPTLSPDIFCVCDHYHPNCSEIIIHCTFDLHFPIISDVNFSVHLLASTCFLLRNGEPEVNVLATKVDDLSSIHRTFLVEGENLHLQVSCPLMSTHALVPIYSHTHKHLHAQ